VKTHSVVNLFVPLLLLLGVRPGLALPNSANGGDSAAPAKVSSAQVPDQKESTGKNGLKIHGHWVIEVRHKDGTVAERREFENSYIGNGFMGFLLGGTEVDVDTGILFYSANNGTGSFCNGASGNECAIFASLTAGHGAVDNQVFSHCPTIATGPSCFTGLTSTLTTSNGAYNSWVLSANITAQGSGTFDTVGTSVGDCFPSGTAVPVTSISSSQCYTNAVSYGQNAYNSSATGPYYNNQNFTATAVPGGAVTITAGETLAFTVTITFQ
jgi:hypothetical protein